MTSVAARAATVADARQHARQRLESTSLSPGADADCLLAAATGLNPVVFRSHPETLLEPAARTAFEAMIERRMAGEPVAYLVGRQAFWDLDLVVGPGVLIPRPETEHLVEAVLEAPANRLLELGCGSGCIALALGRALPACHVDAVDICPTALAIARENARQLGLENVFFHAGDWYQPLPGQRYDTIVANPPYLGEGEPEANLGDLRFEPRQALVAGPTGLEALEHIIANAPSFLTEHGRIWVEHGWQQAEAVRERLTRAGFRAVETRRDLAGHPRISGGQLEAMT